MFQSSESSKTKTLMKFEDRQRLFLTQNVMQINENALTNLRGYISSLVTLVNSCYRNRQPVKFQDILDVYQQPALIGITAEMASDFVRYDYTVTTFKTLCRYYGYHLYIRGKAGKIFVCISSDKQSVEKFESQVIEMYT